MICQSAFVPVAQAPLGARAARPGHFRGLGPGIPAKAGIHLFRERLCLARRRAGGPPRRGASGTPLAQDAPLPSSQQTSDPGGAGR